MEAASSSLSRARGAASTHAGVEFSQQPAYAGVRKRKQPRKVHPADSAVTAEPVTWLAPWTTALGMTEYESKEKRLHDEIVEYLTYIMPTVQERRARKRVIARVEDVVRKRFSDATVTTFGSMAHDLYFPDGDIDLVICVPRKLEHSDKKTMLFQLSAVLKDSLITHKVNVVHRARVPIVSFETTTDLGSFKIDMSINASDGVQAIPIIVDYLDKMPALRHLVFVLKGLLLREQLNSASNGGLSSYAAICLVISFLQLNPGNRPAEFLEKPLESESLGILLTDLLEYYADTFPYETSCISVREGKLLLKEDKGWKNNAQPKSLSIECLVNTEHDVGKSTGKIARVRSAFRDARLSLQNSPFTANYDDALGIILGVTEQTLHYRERLKELVDGGSLEQALAKIRLPQTRSAPLHRPSHSSLPPRPHVPDTFEGGYGAPSHQSGYLHAGFSNNGGLQYDDNSSYGGYQIDYPTEFYYGNPYAAGSGFNGWHRSRPVAGSSYPRSQDRPPKRPRR